MRVLIIYPAIDCPPGINHGVISLSAVLKDAGHDVKLIFANEQVGPIPTKEEIADVVREYRPGLVGYSCMSQQYPWAVEVNAHLKQEFPDIPGRMLHDHPDDRPAAEFGGINTILTGGENASYLLMPRIPE